MGGYKSALLDHSSDSRIFEEVFLFVFPKLGERVKEMRCFLERRGIKDEENGRGALYVFYWFIWRLHIVVRFRVIHGKGIQKEAGDELR